MQVEPKTIMVDGKKVTHYVTKSNTSNTLLCKVRGKRPPPHTPSPPLSPRGKSVT